MGVYRYVRVSMGVGYIPINTQSYPGQVKQKFQQNLKKNGKFN